jgi:hypothetical protein
VSSAREDACVQASSEEACVQAQRERARERESTRASQIESRFVWGDGQGMGEATVLAAGGQACVCVLCV